MKDESVLLPREYSKCILEVKNGVVHYSQECVIEVLTDDYLKSILAGDLTCDADTEEESAYLHAVEWFDYNIACAYMGKYTPVYVIQEGED